MSQQERVALITGGSRGIGRAIALKLAEDGVRRFVINYYNNREAAQEVVDQLSNIGAEALTFRGDVGDLNYLNQMFDFVAEKFGKLDIFISNAAAGALKPTLELSPKSWQRTLDINSRALLIGAQRAAALMPESGGHIVALTSLGSQRYIPGYAAVGVAKAAIETLTRYLAVDLAPRQITVNAVSGGVVETDSIKYFPNYEQLLDVTANRTPMGRIGKPEDIATVVAFLCSPGARWICGQTIIVDGGYSLLA
jgi:enoyl-[acyl-carrier protein] reductase III